MTRKQILSKIAYLYRDQDSESEFKSEDESMLYRKI